MAMCETQIIKEHEYVARQVQKMEARNPSLVSLKRLVNKELPEKLKVAKTHEIPELLRQQRLAEKELFRVTGLRG